MDFSLISQTSLFRGYTPSETEELLRRLRASTRRFVRDSAVYTAGKPVSNIGIVLSGTAQIENNDIWGNTSILGLVKPGEVFAEAYACVPGEPMMVDVIATEDTEILFVNVPEILPSCLQRKGKLHTPDPESCHHQCPQKPHSLPPYPTHLIQKDPWKTALLSLLSGRTSGQ